MINNHPTQPAQATINRKLPKYDYVTVYISNLPHTTTAIDLVIHFETLNDISDAIERCEIIATPLDDTDSSDDSQWVSTGQAVVVFTSKLMVRRLLVTYNGTGITILDRKIVFEAEDYTPPVYASPALPPLLNKP